MYFSNILIAFMLVYVTRVVPGQSNQESKFDFLATPQQLVKIDEGQQKIKIVRTNRQSNLRGSTNQFSPSAGTTLFDFLRRLRLSRHRSLFHFDFNSFLWCFLLARWYA